MRAVQLAGAVTDPEHMGGTVVPAAAEAVLAHERLFVIEQQGLVSGEKTGLAQLGCVVHAAGPHELQGLIDSCAQLVVFLGHLRISDEVEVPLVDLVQIGETALGEGAQQVQAGSGLMVGLQ